MNYFARNCRNFLLDFESQKKARYVKATSIRKPSSVISNFLFFRQGPLNFSFADETALVFRFRQELLSKQNACIIDQHQILLVLVAYSEKILLL